MASTSSRDRVFGVAAGLLAMLVLVACTDRKSLMVDPPPLLSESLGVPEPPVPTVNERCGMYAVLWRTLVDEARSGQRVAYSEVDERAFPWIEQASELLCVAGGCDSECIAEIRLGNIRCGTGRGVTPDTFSVTVEGCGQAHSLNYTVGYDPLMILDTELEEEDIPEEND